MEATYVPALAKKYYKEIIPKLTEKFGYTTIMQVPKLEKIVLNRGIGDAIADKKLIEASVEELSAITGQKAVVTYSKKDISNFKLRKGMPIGVMVTLRNQNMYEFLHRLISIAIPRIRDFKGVDYKMDGRGNYTLGISEQLIFPEIDMDKIIKVMGLQITFVTSAKTDEEAYALLEAFGMPFKKNKKN
jgi:large subunit ribosomal protein L5